MKIQRDRFESDKDGIEWVYNSRKQSNECEPESASSESESSNQKLSRPNFVPPNPFPQASQTDFQALSEMVSSVSLFVEMLPENSLQLRKIRHKPLHPIVHLLHLHAWNASAPAPATLKPCKRTMPPKHNVPAVTNRKDRQAVPNPVDWDHTACGTERGVLVRECRVQRSAAEKTQSRDVLVDVQVCGVAGGEVVGG